MTSWSDLSPQTRKIVIGLAACDTALKAAALIDLARRPAAEVRGSKGAWAAAIVAINSVGLVPTAYFVRGVDRRRRPTH